MNKTLEQWAALDPNAQRTPAEIAILLQHAKDDIAALATHPLEETPKSVRKAAKK